ncbi:MAG: NADP-dependent oxidoreductase [Micrococcaceae bacterium]|nr:NADP-dependent oxidoreductase [Micrococcaceae bacterium]
MTTQSSTQIHLARRPSGWPVHEDFRTTTVQLPDLAEGEVRVANEFISVDPYMRGRMNDAKSYATPYALDEVMNGGAVGRVVQSRAEGLPVGSPVLHQQGWRDIAQGPAAGFRLLQDVPGLPLSAYLGMLGLTGLTAYVGLLHIAELKEGDTVFVSGAAGAVGSAVGQIARLKGASTVIGSAGSDEKVKLLTQKYGFDAAFNYKDAPVREQLAKAAPQGIDVYFDNVGGDHLEAALDAFNQGGRAALCGAISLYNATEPAPGPDNMANMVTRSLKLRGFIVGDHAEHMGEFMRDMTGWIGERKIAMDETVVEGLENAVDAFLELMRGANTGKMVVKL